jgi:hypothetical protein
VSYNLTILQQWKCMLPLRTLAWTVPNTWSDQAKPSASKTIVAKKQILTKCAKHLNVWNIPYPDIR